VSSLKASIEETVLENTTTNHACSHHTYPSFSSVRIYLRFKTTILACARRYHQIQSALTLKPPAAPPSYTTPLTPLTQPNFPSNSTISIALHQRPTSTQQLLWS
jgi:hypothetical protein